MMKIKSFESFHGLVNQKLVKSTADTIIKFLKDNKISTWEEMDENEFSRNVVNKIIDKSARTYQEVEEIKFLLKIELSSVSDLKKMIEEYLKSEDYEKCQIIKNKIESMEFNSYF